MTYRTECETMEGKMLVLPMPSLAAAKRKAQALSRKHITAYAVAVEGTEAVGHVAYGEGRLSETLGRI